jgi:peptide/nickel transport system substrate-binding protein
LVIAAVAVFWFRHIYLSTTEAIPKKGGEYAEGIIGQPVFINPLLSQSSEADADLVQLVYSGLLKYNAEGDLENDLAESYELSEDKKTYTFHLRQDAFWHDGEKLNAEDVKFTVDVIQNQSYKSLLRQNWQGVEVSQADEYTIVFTLSNPYFGFLNNLTTGILPKHIWEDISPEKFSLQNDLNLKPIGSGPYKYSKMQKNAEGEILSYELSAFAKYYSGEPFISKLVINFYPDENSLVEAYNKREVKGMGNIPPEKIGEIKSKKSLKINELVIPRYFSIFFNQKKSIPLASKEVRQALALGLDRDRIIQDVFQGKAVATFSPFLSQMQEFNDEAEKYNFDPEKAKETLEKAGWKMNNEKGVREKNGVELKFLIYTHDWPDLSRTADFVKEQWGAIGVRVELEKLTISDIQQNHIRPREYDALLVGQAINLDPDIYSFWHSSQKQDPGLNLALFDNKKVDELLDEIRTQADRKERVSRHKEIQKIFSEEVPGVFLYSPLYLYPMDKSLKGFEMKKVNIPAWRFADINHWYLKTKRVFK